MNGHTLDPDEVDRARALADRANRMQLCSDCGAPYEAASYGYETGFTPRGVVVRLLFPAGRCTPCWSAHLDAIRPAGDPC